jgi:hypothetical protein
MVFGFAKGNSGMKITFLSLTLFISLILAGCTSALTTMPSESPTTTPEIFIARTQAIPGTEASIPSFEGTAVTYAPLSLIIPFSIASGASGSEYQRVDSDDAAWWQKTPGHLQISLADYYALQGKTIQPTIYVCSLWRSRISTA